MSKSFYVLFFIGIVIISCIIFIMFSIYSYSSGCGINDGPFEAIRVDEIQTYEDIQEFILSDNEKLILDNRTDSLSPILILKENGIVKWTLDTDTRNTRGYESTRISRISKMTIIENSDQLKLNFLGHWTYGIENGSMQINRENGKNSFCLSW